MGQGEMEQNSRGQGQLYNLPGTLGDHWGREGCEHTPKHGFTEPGFHFVFL